MATQDQDRLSALEQENALLRSRLQACEQAYACLQAQIVHERQHQLGLPTAISSDSITERQLWEATTTATNVLLTFTNFDEAVNTALQIIGEALDTDRIGIIENFDPPSDSAFPCWRSLDYEWNSRGTVLQHTDAESSQGTYKEIPEIFEQLHQGRAISYLIEEAPEPFCSAQRAIGVRATHLVPIFIESRWWGVLELDDCREEKRCTQAELSVLKIAADCIGSAIQRQQTQQALLQSEQNRVAELAEANKKLQQRERLLSVVAQVTQDLLADENTEFAIPAALQAIGEAAQMSRVLLLLERQDATTQRLQHCVEFEWTALGILKHAAANLNVMDNEDFQVLVQSLHEKQSMWSIVNELPSVTRSHFERLNIQSTGVVPIFIEGGYVGCITFDDCVMPRQWTQTEMDVLTAAAESIGAALHRKQLGDRLIEEQIRAEQERAAELAEVNTALQRQAKELQRSYRLLETTAITTNTLLSTENLDDAINAVLQIVGEALDTDRTTVIEFFEHSPEPLPHWRILYEWNSPGTLSQMVNPELRQGTQEGLEDIYQILSQGQPVSCFTEELHEPFRSGQAKLGVKGLHAVPIFVKGQLWGVIGFDDCREAKQRSALELSALKIMADCIGSAIQRQRTQQLLLQTEQQRVEELAVINDELQQTLVCLSQSEEHFRTLFEFSSEGFYYVEVDPPCPVTLPLEQQCEWLYRHIRVVKANPAFAAMYGADHPDQLIGLRNADVHVPNSDKNNAFIRSTIENGYRFQNLETEELDQLGRQRYFLNSGVYTLTDGYIVGGWGTQIDITELRETQQALLTAEQDRAFALEQLNGELQQTLKRLQTRERFLETTAIAANHLLTTQDFDRVVNTALESLGKSLDTDRFIVIEFFQQASAALPYWRVLYEWTAPGMRSRMTHPKLIQGSFVGIEDLFHQFSQGQPLSYCLEDLPEPFRSNQAQLDIQGMYSIPIFVNGLLWGAIGFDDCRETKQRSAVELSVLKITADCIGSAIERRRSQQALLQVEQNRAAELAKANTTLKKTLDVLATETNLDRALGSVLGVLTEQLESSSSALWLYNPETQRFSLHLVYLNGDIIPATPETIDRLTGQWTRDQELPRDLRFKQHICDRKPVIYEVANFPESSQQFMQRLGVKTLLGVPLMLGSEIIGSFTVRFTETRQFQAEELELTQALAHQATLAIQLTRLSAIAQHETQQSAILGERNRMARDLHDTLAQNFTGIVMQLEATQAIIPPTISEPAQKHLHRAGLLARQGLQEARRSVWSLRSEALESADLPTALLRIAQQMTEHTTIQTDVIVDGTAIALPKELEDHLLRIGQEALTNALKHAQPQQIRISLQFTSNVVQLQIIDDGRGFNPQQQWRGYGITCMQERTYQLGGEFNLSSQVGQGTTIHVTIPLAPSEAGTS